jgi:hypothetical protein
MRFDSRPSSGLGRIPKWFIAIWLLAGLVSLGVSGGLIYAGIHFISKWW